MRRFLSLLLALALMFVISACGEKTPERETERSAVEVELINTHFETYDYQQTRVELNTSGSYIYAALAHENRLYYVTFEKDSQDKPVMVVTSINTDGSDAKRVEIQNPGDEVLSFNITGDGDFAFFMFNRTLTQQGFDRTAFYIEYDRDGIELTQREIKDFTLVEHPQPNTFAVLNDGRVLAIDPNDNKLNEIDFTNQKWGETYLVAENSGRIRGIFSTSPSSPFDILLSDDSYLYGYCFETNEQTVLLNWIQVGFADVFFNIIGIFDDGRIFMLIPNRSAASEAVTELYILTPVNRNEMPEKITLTLRALTVGDDVRRAVILFNSQNPLYRIEIYEYINQASYPSGGVLTPDVMKAVFDQAMMRFQVDLMAGKIPDIFCSPTFEIIEGGFLLDLNPFIDADPDINIADFFPNVFAGLQESDGTLLTVSRKFDIRTFIGRNETLGHLEAWTPADLLALIRSTQGMALPFGRNMLREDLLEQIRYNNLGFLDFDNYQANFDSDEFINFLNAAKLLPSRSDLPPDTFSDFVLEIRNLLEGNQILSYEFFSSPNKYQAFAESISDGLTLGIPTITGGEHIILYHSTIGIGINSKHTNAAWDFIRGFLLPSATEFDYISDDVIVLGEIGFPIRIDLFNELIDDAMTTRTFVNRDGETVESSRETFNAQDGSTASINVLTMSKEIANGLRAFIESAVPGERGISDELWKIIEGDLADFYAGARSAEETARIIQNRAERWLSEQKLLAGG